MEKNTQIAIVLISESSLSLARKISKEFPQSTIYTKSTLEGCENILLQSMDERALQRF